MSQSEQRSAKRATIKDVAQAAGVSVTTVSNVLNNRTGAMAEETLQRIQDTMQALNYRPSSVARSMVTQRTATVGLIIAEIETPLFLQALNVIEPIARQANYNILVCSASNIDDEQRAVELLLEKQVDGIIFISQSRYIEDDYLNDLSTPMPPLVMINRTPPYDGFDTIHWGNTGGMVKAVEHLVKLGHSRIAHLHGPNSRRSSEERFEGYKLGLQRNNLEFKPEYVCLGDYETTPDQWEQATLKLLQTSPKPTAIIASNDTVAAVVIRTVQQSGLRVPQDISVIGNDNQPFCIFLNPTLTTVELPIITAGRKAIETLLAKMTNPDKAAEHIQIPCPLIVRESTGPVQGAVLNLGNSQLKVTQ